MRTGLEGTPRLLRLRGAADFDDDGSGEEQLYFVDALMGDELQTRWAVAGEVDAIARVVNAAFRRAESFFVVRERIDVAALRRMMLTGKFLLGEERGELLGCVYLELRGERAYFGLLAVDPARQRKGLGRRLICEVEDAARRAGCRFMDIQIVNLRAELPPFYRAIGICGNGDGSVSGGSGDEREVLFHSSCRKAAGVVAGSDAV